ncbi:hypothetical protein Pcinc_024352 [Petrolisthes cinctipes]|uniref:Uncharacterized protein n=1 Tax=Petrolisthes cinctipes TaxID=88211 RepID=A0AAE1KDP8_PETCI|nr:hypothetical protein Pcinc_024352 [Petrolisthes cinctipes]
MRDKEEVERMKWEEVERMKWEEVERMGVGERGGKKEVKEVMGEGKKEVKEVMGEGKKEVKEVMGEGRRKTVSRSYFVVGEEDAVPSKSY